MSSPMSLDSPYTPSLPPLQREELGLEHKEVLLMHTGRGLRGLVEQDKSSHPFQTLRAYGQKSVGGFVNGGLGSSWLSLPLPQVGRGWLAPFLLRILCSCPGKRGGVCPEHGSQAGAGMGRGGMGLQKCPRPRELRKTAEGWPKEAH